MVENVAGITIRNQGIVSGEEQEKDEWSFDRGGVFVVGGFASKRDRSVLHYRLKTGGGITRTKAKYGHIIRGHSGIPSSKYWMLLADDDKKSDDKDDLCDKEHIAEKRTVSRNSIFDSIWRKVPFKQKLPDTGSIKDCKRKAPLPAMRESATHVGSRWGQDLSKGKDGSVDVKDPCKEAKNSAHRGLGRNGGLEDSNLCGATKIIMSKPQNSWDYTGGWWPSGKIWGASQEEAPAASSAAPTYQPAPESPAPMPETEPATSSGAAQTQWESWDEVEDAIKKKKLIEEIRKKPYWNRHKEDEDVRQAIDADKKRIVMEDIQNRTKQRDDLRELQAGSNRWAARKEPASKEKDEDDAYEKVETREASVGWDRAWEAASGATSSPITEERPKKMAKGEGRGFNEEDEEVNVYANPNKYRLPSKTTIEVEQDWWKSSVHAVPGEDDKATFTRAFWGKFGDHQEDRTDHKFWLDISNGVGWMPPAALVQCWDCKMQVPNYKLYVSHRECETLYMAYDMKSRRVIGRCVECEHGVRNRGDLPYYARLAGVTLTKDQLKDPSTITRVQWAAIASLGIEVVIQYEARNPMKQSIDKHYFTIVCVRKCLSWQTKSKQWYKDARMYNDVDKRIDKEQLKGIKLVIVCKASVNEITKQEAQGARNITEVACNREDESSMLLSGELKPQTRDVEKLVPKTTIQDLNKPLEEIDFGQYLKSRQDDDDDEECDQRCCKICAKPPLQFKTQWEERRHRESPPHLDKLQEMSQKEVWNCMCCGFRVENTRKARSPAFKDESDSKRLFMAHLKSDEHQDKVRKIYNKYGGAEICAISTNVARKILRVSALVYQSAVAVLFTAVLLDKNDKMARILQAVFKTKVTKMKLIASLVDKVNEEDRIRDAQEEGGDGKKTASTAFNDSLGEIAKLSACSLGVEDNGIVPGSKEQSALYNVLDNEDQIVQGVGLFNCCTHCGLAYSGKLWWNKDEGTGYDPTRFNDPGSELFVTNEEAFTAKPSNSRSKSPYYRCLLEWRQLEQAKDAETRLGRTNGCATQMWDSMVAGFGEDWKKWPIKGCGRAFTPYSNGPSMILEMEVEEGHHVSLLAERPPDIINHAFKEAKLMAWNELKKEARFTINFAEMFDWLSNTFPMDKEFMTKGWDGQVILGVNKFPLDLWNASQREYMTQRSWTGLAFYVAAGHDSVVMNELRNLAHGVEAPTNEQELINGNLGKKKVLALAAKKCSQGIYAPRTAEEVGNRKPTFGYAVDPLGPQKNQTN